MSGYRVFYGPAPGRYTEVLDVGNTTAVTVRGLSDCTTWYLAVKAYNRAGESPGFSNEVRGWPRPEVISVDPAVRIQGERFTLNLRGANFQPGATVAIDNPHVFLDSATTLSCNRLQVAATIEPTAAGVRPAEIGRYSFTVVNPDDVFGVGNRLFEVGVNPARFDLDRRPPSDGRLDGRDTIWLSRSFAAREGEAGYRPDSDFNGDGWVDGDDLAYLVLNLGGCWSGAGWSVAACPE